MGTALQRIDRIANITFGGKKIANQIAQYAQENQRFAHDMARELDAAAAAAEAAMLDLKGHPALLGLDVQARAWWVSRHLREARELCEGLSAEMVKFNTQFRQEFIEAVENAKRSTKKNDYKGRVDL